VARNQHEQAQSIGSVLCVSCVGLEEAARPEEVRLSAAGVEALAALDRDVKLTVFYAEWCHSCPAAERLVELVADASEHITYRFVDVEASPEEALAAGIVESDRTIVPAIVMEGSPTVLFGISDLEDRLLDLLGVGR
jgi:glutaredoxin